LRHCGLEVKVIRSFNIWSYVGSRKIANFSKFSSRKQIKLYIKISKFFTVWAFRPDNKIPFHGRTRWRARSWWRRLRALWWALPVSNNRSYQ